MADLLANVNLKKADGVIKKGSDVLAVKQKVVALYFAAHWCPTCRRFTPTLKEFYKELNDDQFEIVFVSLDRSEEDLDTYLKESHGDWYCIPFGSLKLSSLFRIGKFTTNYWAKIENKYEVAGIPMLIVIKSDGTIITKNGRADVSGKAPPQTLSSWLAAAPRWLINVTRMTSALYDEEGTFRNEKVRKGHVRKYL
ncbi:Nucleoredoxin [Dirofilaria immitis]|nr:Nucleoredoxin [Dirofilaria immitis]